MWCIAVHQVKRPKASGGVEAIIVGEKYRRKLGDPVVLLVIKKLGESGFHNFDG